MSGVLITGTDTGVGKTLVCGLLAQHLRGRGFRAMTQKWVQTGCRDGDDDVAAHADLAGLAGPETAGLDADRCPYRLQLPASPHLAAREEGVQIDSARIEAAYRRLCERFQPVLVEGIGGPLVPLTDRLLLADLAARLRLPAVLVVRNRLGCINHALLSVEALRSRGVPLAGIVFNRPDAGDPVVLDDNCRIVGELSGVPVLGELGRLEDPARAGALFAPIGQAFLQQWSLRENT